MTRTTTTPEGNEIWVCPRCRGSLRWSSEEIVCLECGTEYPVVAGIPDFRVDSENRRGFREERVRARQWGRRAEELPAEELIDRLFCSRSGWSTEEARERVRAILEGPDRLCRELGGWLKPCLPEDGPVLDLGCGAGQLLVALARTAHRPVGLDLSLELLVAARELLRREGVRPVLAAGDARSLPLPDATIPTVISLDVIEHVDETALYLSEIERALGDGGAMALTTPNRYSLASEPHVSVWGVGWLPRRFQKAYAEWRGDLPYENVRLLSLRELQRLVRRYTSLDPEVLVPEIPEEEIAHFPVYRRVLARGYNTFTEWPVGQMLLRPVAPFYRLRAFRH